MFIGNDLPHELLLTTRQKTKLRNAFNNKMQADIKLFKAQISKIIQSGRFLWSLLSKLAGPLMKVAVPLAKNILAPLGISWTLKFKRKFMVWNNDFNNFKRRNERHNENCSSSWRF